MDCFRTLLPYLTLQVFISYRKLEEIKTISLLACSIRCHERSGVIYYISTSPIQISSRLLNDILALQSFLRQNEQVLPIMNLSRQTLMISPFSIFFTLQRSHPSPVIVVVVVVVVVVSLDQIVELQRPIPCQLEKVYALVMITTLFSPTKTYFTSKSNSANWSSRLLQRAASSLFNRS